MTLHETRKPGPTSPGDPLLRGTQTRYQAGGRPARRLGVVPPTRGYTEVGRQQATDVERCAGSRVVPSRCHRQGVPLALLPPAPSSDRVSPSRPPPAPPPRRRPAAVVRSAAHPLSGTRPPRDSPCLPTSPLFLGLVPGAPHPRRVTWLRGKAEPRGGPGPRASGLTGTDSGSVSDWPARGQGEARAKGAAAAAGAESASGPVPPPLLRGRPYPVVTLRPPTFANTMSLPQPCLSPSAF